MECGGQLVDAAVDRVQRWHDKLTQAQYDQLRTYGRDRLRTLRREEWECAIQNIISSEAAKMKEANDREKTADATPRHSITATDLAGLLNTTPLPPDVVGVVCRKHRAKQLEEIDQAKQRGFEAAVQKRKAELKDSNDKGYPPNKLILSRASGSERNQINQTVFEKERQRLVRLQEIAWDPRRLGSFPSKDANEFATTWLEMKAQAMRDAPGQDDDSDDDDDDDDLPNMSRRGA